MQYKSLLILGLLLGVSIQYWTLDLKEEKINDKVNNVELKPFLDSVFYADVTFKEGQQPQKTLLDSTVSQNWILVKEIISQGTPISPLGTRATLKGTVVNQQDLFINNQRIGESSIYQVTYENPVADKNGVVVPGSEVQYFTKGFKSGLGLNSNKADNFINSLSKAIRLEKKGFSIFCHSQINQIRFGQEEKYFADEEFSTFENKLTDKKLWGLQVKKLTSAKETFEINEAANSFFQFDTTTKFLWVQENVYNKMKQFMTSKDPSATCNDDADAKILKCTCKAQYPDFEFTFSQDKNLEKKIFKWSKENYLVSIPDDPTYCEVLFRKATKFDAAAPNALPTLVDTATPPNNYIIAGTSFLKQNYVYFDLDKQTISLAKAFNLQQQAKQLNPTVRYLVIIGGILLFIVALAALLGILTKCPYNPQIQAQPPQVKQQFPEVKQSIPLQQQQQVILQPIVQQQPQTIYFQAPQQSTYVLTQQPFVYQSSSPSKVGTNQFIPGFQQK